MKKFRIWFIAMIGVVAVAGTILASSLGLRRGGPAGTFPGQRMRHDASAHLSLLPSMILWAWDRPEDLRFLVPKQVGVSFLAQTLTLAGGAVHVKPRLHPLKVMPGTPLVACTRIEVDGKNPPTLTSDQVVAVASALARLGTLRGVIAIQVDFDATKSQRAFYAELLRELRRRLPPAMPLSITALASWCAGDPWLAGLPMDEAVPMIFRMGPDAPEVRLLLTKGGDFTPSVCRESIGISTDEAIPSLPSLRRRYIFHPGGWSQAALRALMAEGIRP
jgi:hypothetical protein